MPKKKVVIVGGGTAGLVIAESIKEQFDVIVLEKSKQMHVPLLNKVPLLVGPLYRKTVLKFVRKIDVVPQYGRVISFFESCVFGGASVINGCVHALGLRTNWDAELKRFSLGYLNVVEACDTLYTERFRSLSKKLKLRLASHNTLDRTFFRSLQKFGLSETGLFEAERSGYGKVVNTVGLFFRSSVRTFFKRQNLKFYIGEDIIQIELAGQQQFKVSSVTNVFNADYVILCAGVIGTNLLFLKKNICNIGNEYLVENHIGRNIKDHSNVRVNVRATKKFGSLNEINKSFIKKFYVLAKHFVGLDTVLLGTGATSGVHLDLDGDGIVDTRIHLLQFSETGRHKSDGNDFCPGPGFSLSITPIKTMSSGEIMIDASGQPIVNPGYFSKKADLDLVKSALSFCLKILKSEPMSEFVEEIEDQDLIENDPEKYIKETFFSGHHLIGGCSDLVNGNFEVKGLPGIFICDASIFSEFVSSNIHAPVVLLAKLFSDRFVESDHSSINGVENARL